MDKLVKTKETRLNTVDRTKRCANPESNRGPNDGNVGFYH